MYKNFKHFEKAGIIYVMEQAAKQGFTYDNSEWCNLGQGAAEAGEIEGNLARISELRIGELEQGYAPVAGRKKLRENIAGMYNDIFRSKLENKYAFNNIAVAGGGRTAISRVVSCLQNIKIGYFVPDYSSYEGILAGFNNVEACPIFLRAEDNYKIDVELIKSEIEKQKLGAIIFSNPSNPTGNILMGEDLKNLLDFARQKGILLIIDEFYFNYIYEADRSFVSASEYIEDVDNDNVIIISGLSKSWRYSGFRICWTVGSKDLTENIAAAGSFLDGGANNPLQKASETIISREAIEQETKAIQTTFKPKRDFMIASLEKLGFKIVGEARGAFYVWASVENLTERINTGDKFFEACLQEKVIVVPGKFFDLNPGKFRTEKRFEGLVRFSYGPKMDTIEKGMEAIKGLISKMQ